MDDRFCEAERRPHSSIVCFGHCPRCAHHLGPWTSWSPFHCDACVGRQRRRLVCNDRGKSSQVSDGFAPLARF